MSGGRSKLGGQALRLLHLRHFHLEVLGDGNVGTLYDFVQYLLLLLLFDRGSRFVASRLWWRERIISVTSSLPDADIAAQRLLQNQVDIGNAIKPVYGDEAGEQLTFLLNDHILITADLMAAANAGDNTKFEDANKRWYNNADQIAAFLNSANPDHWPLADMQSMMNSHLDLTLEEATARLNADWSGDVAAYDKVHDEILDMAGMLTQGIVAQFPDTF